MAYTENYEKTQKELNTAEERGYVIITSIPQELIEKYHLRVGMLTPFSLLRIIDPFD